MAENQSTDVATSSAFSGFAGMLSAEKINVEGGSTKLVYSAPISDKIAFYHFLLNQLNGCSFALCHSKELKKGSYIHLYEDRLEWNFPTSCCLTIIDHPQVLYLDRDVNELQTIPDCCRPMCTHCSCCPTLWDLNGEMVMLHGQNSCFWLGDGKISMHSIAPPAIGCPQMCYGRPCPILNRTWIMLPFLEDANKLKFEIRKVREKLVKSGHAQNFTIPPDSDAQSRNAAP